MTIVHSKFFHQVSHLESVEAQPHSQKYLGGLSSGPQDLNFDGRVDSLEVYAAQLKQWLIERRESGASEDIDWGTLQNYIEYTSEGLGVAWDPLEELGWNPQLGTGESVGGPAKTSDQNLYFEGAEARLQVQGEGLARHIWSNDVQIDVPSLATDLVSVEVTQDNLIPPKQVLKLVFNNQRTGKNDVVFVEDFSDATLRLRLPEGMQLNPAVLAAAEAIKPGLMVQETWTPNDTDSSQGAASESEPKPELIHGERVWKRGNAVNYFMTPGTEIDRIMLDAADFNSEDRTQQVFITKNGPHDYEIVYQDAQGKVLRTIKASQISSLNFKGVYVGHVFFRDMSPGAKAPQLLPVPGEVTPQLGTSAYHAWNEFEGSPDTQIMVEGYSAPSANAAAPANGTPVNAAAEKDTPPTSLDVSQKKASYQRSKVELTALNSDDKTSIDQYEITHASEVILKKSAEGNSVEITQIQEGEYSIVFTSPDGARSQTFHVHSSNIRLNADLEPKGNITYRASASAPPVAYQPGMDSAISVQGEEFPGLVTDLSDWLVANGETEMTPSRLMQKAKQVGLADAELLYPSIPPSAAMLQFLEAIDPALQHYHEALKGDKADDKLKRAQYRDRLVALMQVLYSDQQIEGGYTGHDGTDDISIGGEKYDIIRNSGDQAHRGEIRFAQGDDADG